MRIPSCNSFIPELGFPASISGLVLAKNNSIGEADPQIRFRRKLAPDPLTPHDDEWPMGKGYIGFFRLAATRA